MPWTCRICGSDDLRADAHPCCQSTLIPVDEPIDPAFVARHPSGQPDDLTWELDVLIEALVAGGHVLDVEQDCGPPEMIEEDEPEPLDETTDDAVLPMTPATQDEVGGWLIEFDFRSASPSRHIRRGRPVVLDFRVERIDLESVG